MGRKYGTPGRRDGSGSTPNLYDKEQTLAWLDKRVLKKQHSVSDTELKSLAANVFGIGRRFK